MSIDTQEVILGKLEGSNYNRDPGMTAADNAFMVEGPITITYSDAKMRERNPVGPAMGGAKALYGGSVLVSISFKIKPKGSGTPTTPPEAGILWQAAGFLETIGASDVSYALSSVQANHKSAAFAYYEGPMLHKITGAFVEKFDFSAEMDGMVDVTITGHTCEWGLAQAGGAATITLAADHAAVDDIYNGQQIRIIAGTGAGQTRTISDYVGSTKIATVSVAWTTQPDNTSVYAIDNGPIDSALPTPTFDATVEPVFTGAQVKVGSYAPEINNLSVSMGLKLVKPTSVSSPDGFGRLRFGPRAVSCSFEPELDTVANKDWLAEWKAGTEATIDTGTVGQTVGNRWRMQVFRVSQKAAPTQGSRESIRTRKIEGQAEGRTADGEVVFTFS